VRKERRGEEGEENVQMKEVAMLRGERGEGGYRKREEKKTRKKGPNDKYRIT